MPRPFAVIGFTVFFVMLLFCFAGYGYALPAFFLFSVLFCITFAVKSIRIGQIIPLAMASAAVACIVFGIACKTQYEVPLSYVGQERELVTVLLENPQKEYGRYVCEAKVIAIDGENTDFKTNISFRCEEQPEAYDKVSGIFCLEEPSLSSVTSLHIIDGICVNARVAEDNAENAVLHKIPVSEKPIGYRLLMIRTKISDSLFSVVPGERGQLASALLLGKTDDFPANIRQNFLKVGVSHLVCVSGLHLSVWGLLLYRAFQKFRLSRKLGAVLSMLFILLFIGITGCSYSVLRAGFMMLVFLAGNLFNRKSDGLNSLGLSATVLLLFDPLCIADFGFVLSFLSTLSLLLFAPVAQKKIQNVTAKIPWAFLEKSLRYGLNVVAIGVCVSVLTLPVILVFAGNVNFLSLIGNLLMLGVSSCCMVAAGITALCATVPFLRLFSFTAGLICSETSGYLITVAEKLSRLEILTFYPNERIIYSWVCFAMLFVAVSLMIAFDHPIMKKICSFGVAFSLLCVLLASDLIAVNTVTLCVTNCGNGSAFLLQKGTQSVLLGCGASSSEGDTAILTMLSEKNIDNLQLVVLPRSQKTESGSITSVCDACNVEKIVVPQSDAAPLEEITQAEIFGFSKNCKINLWHNAALEIYDGYAVLSLSGNKVLFVFTPSASFSSSVAKADCMICRSAIPANLQLSHFRCIVVSGDTFSVKKAERFSEMRDKIIVTADAGEVILKSQFRSPFKLSK